MPSGRECRFDGRNWRMNIIAIFLILIVIWWPKVDSLSVEKRRDHNYEQEENGRISETIADFDQTLEHFRRVRRHRQWMTTVRNPNGDRWKDEVKWWRSKRNRRRAGLVNEPDGAHLAVDGHSDGTVYADAGDSREIPSSNSDTMADSASSASSGGAGGRKKLLIGYLAGTPFGGLDSLLVNTSKSKSSKSGEPLTYQEGMASDAAVVPLRAASWSDRNRARRRADAYADPEAYPDPYPDAYPDPEPLESLRVVAKDGNTSMTISMKDLAQIFFESDIIGTSKYLQGHMISGAIRYAVEVVNNDPNLLPDYELTFKFCNTKGLTRESVKWVMELWKMGAVAFIGPEDSCRHEAMMAAAQNLPMISYKCADYAVSDKSKYTTFARTVPDEGEVAKATVSLLQHFKWYKFTLICQGDEVHKLLAEGIAFWAEKYSYIQLQNTTFYRAHFSIDTKSSSEEVKRIVQETYKNTRIYVVLGDQGFLQLMLLEMGNANLLSKGEYAIVYVDHTYGYVDADDAAINRYYRPTIQLTDANSEIVHRLAELSRSLFVVVPTPVSFTNAEYQKFWSKVVQYNAEEPFKVYRAINIASAASDKAGRLNTQKPIDNRYASYLYDAVLLYAQALDETLNAGGNYTDGSGIMKRILGRKYRSMQGFDVKIDEFGNAKGNFTLLTRQNISHSKYNFTVSMVPTGWFVDTAEPEGLLALALHERMFVDWIGGKPPVDEPLCGFHNERCKKEPKRTREITGSVLAVLSIALAMVAFMIYRNRKIEKELAGMIWKIDPKEIQFVTQDGYAAVLGASRVTLASQESAGQDTGSLWPVDFHCLAKYRGSLVAIKEIRYGRKLREITRATKMEMKKMRGLHHDNVNNFMGIIVKVNQIYVVREYCAKGSLYDVLLNENIKLDDLFIASFIDDLLKAMCYLHESELRVHGNLKSTNCVITSRWSLQVADYGLHELREGQEFQHEMQRYKALLWTAPEILLAGAIDRPQKGTQKGDVFSIGIIIHEIFTRTGPYGIESDCCLTAMDIYTLIVKTRQGYQNGGWIDDSVRLESINMAKPFLPNLDGLQCQNYAKEVLLQCWDDRPNERPDIRTIRHRLKPLFKGILRRNIMDHMMAMMEKYQNHLEQLVDERTEALNEEKKRVETLLHRMLPDSVAAQLMRGEDVIPESYDAVTIYFSDIVGFTSLSAESTPMEVVNFLNTLYTLFDGIIRRYDVYKVETIGDAYMVVSGLPIRNGDKHAGEIATMALHLLKAIESFRIPHRPDKKLLLRIGMHTGPCVAGVVGKTMPRYCLFGDTVNTASRMESNGLPLKIHCSENVERALSILGGYVLEERGLVPMKGKGEMLTYWLLYKQEFVMASPVDDLPSEPLFKTKDTARPPTGNVTRRRMAAESLLHLPSDEESLTAIIRRTPSKRTESAATSKSLQRVPAFSSAAGKPVTSSTGGGSSKSSRILLTTAISTTENNRQKRPSVFVQMSGGSPPSYQDCVRHAASKRSSLRATSRRGKTDGHRSRRRLSTDGEDDQNTMRKRSVSFPENVQALAEQFVSLGLGKDGRTIRTSETSCDGTAGQSTASSALETSELGRHYSPDRTGLTTVNADYSILSSEAQLSPVDREPRAGNSIGVPTDENERSNFESEMECNPGRRFVSRKRSLSCGDVEISMLSCSRHPVCSAHGSLPAESHGSIQTPNTGLAWSTNPAGPTERASAAVLGTGNLNRTLIVHDRRRSQQTLSMGNYDDNCCCDSPLLAAIGDADKTKLKSMASLHSLNRPLHNVWRARREARKSLPAVDANGENGFNRLMRHLKRPTSEDRMVPKNLKQPSLV